MRIGIVGAGLAGLSAARRLADTHGGAHEVVVLDKGRSPGGRMATRRLTAAGQDDPDRAIADHGAQFFTVRDPAFADEVAGWPVEIWHHGPMTADSILDDPSTAAPAGDGHPRRVGSAGMNAIARHLAADLDVRCGVRVTAVTPEDEGGYRLAIEDGAPVDVDRVLITAPVPQAIDLLTAGGLADRIPAEVRDLAYEPCLSLLALLDGPSGLAPPGAVQFAGGPVNHLADNQAKGISGRPTITVHATGEWSAAHADDADAQVAEALWAMVAPWLARGAELQQVKRWRYATPINPHAQRAVVLRDGLVLAGDAFGGPKVEGAVRSGWAAAELLDG